jgi:hypothetical protein
MILAVEGDLSSYHHGGYSIASNRLMLGPLDEMVVTRLDDEPASTGQPSYPLNRW